MKACLEEILDVLGLIDKICSRNDIGDLIVESKNHHWKGDSRVGDDLYEAAK